MLNVLEYFWMIHLSLAFLHLHVQEILLDLIVALWARNVTMQFLVLPSLQLLDEEGEWDVLLGSSFLWGFKASNRRKCKLHTCKCLFQSALVEILPVVLQQSVLPEQFTSVLGHRWDACAVAAASPRDLVWESIWVCSWGFWGFFSILVFWSPPAESLS